MAIHVSCSACGAALPVDDSYAGKEILCPKCGARIGVPSIAAGEPVRQAEAGDTRVRSGSVPQDAAYHDEERDERDERDDYDDVRRLTRFGQADWRATATGLGIIFWAGAVIAVLAVLGGAVGMAVGSNPGMFGMAPGAAPRPEMMAAGLGIMVLGCSMLVAGVVLLVGMAMCCSAPPESGARGRAIATMVMIGVLIVASIVFGIAVAGSAIAQFNQGGPPAPGQLPISPGALLFVTIATGVGYQLVVTLWLLFHKAVADHFQNVRLARASTWFIVVFAVFLVGSQSLQYLANPALMQGNLLAQPDPTMFLVAQAWGLVWATGLSIWFLFIVRETRRTILEDDVPRREA